MARSASDQRTDGGAHYYRHRGRIAGGERGSTVHAPARFEDTADGTLELHRSGVAMSVTQGVFDGLVTVLSAAAGGAKVVIGRPGDTPPEDRPDVLVTPLSLRRIGRSRRVGSLLDLELAVAVQAAGGDVLGLTERLLLAAEATPHVRIDPLPDDTGGFGFVVVLGASVAITEPTGPPVTETVVEVHPLAAVTGTVVNPDGTALAGAEVRSSLTRQQTATDLAGRFSLLGISRPTTLTVTRGPRRTSHDVPAGTTDLRIVLPIHEGS